MKPAEQIRSSWEANAAAWITTLDNDEIESRRLVTNAAIVNAVIKLSPNKIIDLGCGEGWLSRRLREHSIEAWGADATPQLVDAAIERDDAYYFCLNYEEIINGGHQLPMPFDAALINFALFDKDVTESLLGYLPQLLVKDGYVLLQTLHPLTIAATEAYTSGWKDGSWNGFKQAFVLPYQWYFRTFADWFALFTKTGFVLEQFIEPLHPQTQKPASVIFVLKVHPLHNLLP